MRKSPFGKNTWSSRFSNFIRTQHTSANYQPLPAPSEATRFYISLLRQCATEKSVRGTRRVHLHMKMAGFPHLTLGNKLVDAYLKCGGIDDAREVFDEMLHPHIVSWNSMVSSYIHQQRSQEAIELYRRMLREGILVDEFTFSSIFRAFSDLGLVLEGRRAHGQLLVLGLEAKNVFVGSALVNMYAKFGKMREARVAYDRIIDKDVVLATALIVGYTQNGEDVEAIQLFGDVVNGGIKANEFTFASVLIACGNLGELNRGMLIHGVIFKSGFDARNASQTSLLSMYSKCGQIDDSLKVFNQIVNPNIVTWTAIIGGLVCNHREEQALSMLRSMIRDSIDPNAFTFSTALRGCSGLALFVEGKQIHACAIKNGLDRNRFVVAALIDMYGKCGHVAMARFIYDNLLGFDLVSMNSMIYGYAQNGYGKEAVKLFDLMHHSGLEPNDATFISVLSACTNSGLLEEGRRIFYSITNNYRIRPSRDHYTCMVDLLGRVGRLEEAEGLIVTQIKNPDIVLWRTLLSACKIHGKLEIAERAARKVLELDPGDDGTYILLSNIYASLGHWNEVISMKTAMRKMKLKKDPAISWVEVNREIHTFMAGDRSHPRATEIYKELEGLIEKTKGLGYVPNTRFVLQELDELEKERSLYYHSEKLAITFGLLSSNGPKGLMIFKNLRVCGDCHTWIKLVSQVEEKEIITRDAKRFHHFRDGVCSCGDYW